MDGEAAAPFWHPTDGWKPRDSCVMCNKSPAQQCKQCRSSWYCSKDCQTSDWPSHKLLCKQFSAQPPRPSPDHRRAILFPADRAKPEMIWIPCERLVDDEDGMPFEMLRIGSLLGDDEPWLQTLHVEYNSIRGRRLGSGMSTWAPRKEGYAVALKVRETFLVDGSPINRSVLTALGSGVSPHTWCGPMLALRGTPSEFYEDVELVDFRHLIDFWLSYGS